MFRHPLFEYLPISVHMPPAFGWQWGIRGRLGNLGKGWVPIGGVERWERLDCSTCNAGLSCKCYPRCVAAGTSLGFCWVMGHWHIWTWLPLCSWKDPVFPSVWYWSILGLVDVLWNCYDGEWEKGLEVLLNPISQCTTWFSYVGLRTNDVRVFQVIDDPT